jgi:CheY-like chemotaxis protein
MTLGAALAPGAHAGQFYDGDAWLSAAIVGFLADPLRQGAPTVMIARPRTFDAMLDHLASGSDPALFEAASRIRFIDAGTALEGFMVDGMPDSIRLERIVGELMADIYKDRPDGPMWIYGEMADVLCRRGQHAAAVELEELWNRRFASPKIALMCGYGLASFDDDAPGTRFRRVCQAHTHVLPAESFSGEADERTRLEQIAWLQQQARAHHGTVLTGTPAAAPVSTSVVYVIDDDESMRRSLVRLLESADRQVQAFASADAFLAAVHRTARGCLLLDIQLSGLNGIDLLIVMAAAGWQMPVIAMSGLHGDRMETDALREGARAFLHKPFDADVLFDAIDRAGA